MMNTKRIFWVENIGLGTDIFKSLRDQSQTLNKGFLIVTPRDTEGGRQGYLLLNDSFTSDPGNYWEYAIFPVPSRTEKSCRSGRRWTA